MIYLVVGISGVGKTTVLNKAREKLPNVKVVNWGTLMLEIAKEDYGVESRDKLKFLTPEETRELQKKVIQKVKDMGDVIVDTHLGIESPRGFIQGIPSWVARELKPDRLIVVEAPPEEIARRRAKDKGKRERMEESVESIRMHLDFDRAIAASIGYELGIPVKIVVNIDLDKAVEDFLKAFD